MITDNEKQFIKDFISGNIERNDLLRLYPINLNEDKDYILQGLNNAFARQNPEDVEYLLYLLPFDKELTKPGKYLDIFCKLLKVSWHYQHESLANLLQGLKDPKSVDCLYKAASAKFDYLDYDDTYSLARKCIHALGDINTEYAKEKLRLLAASSIPIIKEKAEKQLY